MTGIFRISWTGDEIEKPLVSFDDNLITMEITSLKGVKVVLVEGTYTSLLLNVRLRVLIECDYLHTRKSRERRAREDQDDFLEKVLEREHEIILTHRPRADIIVTNDYDAEMKENASFQ